MEFGGDSSRSKNLGLWRWWWREGTVPILPSPLPHSSPSPSPLPPDYGPRCGRGRGVGEHKRPRRRADPERKRGARGRPRAAGFLMLPIQPRGGEVDVGRGEGGEAAAADLTPLLGLRSRGGSRGAGVFSGVKCAKRPFHSFLWGMNF